MVNNVREIALGCILEILEEDKYCHIVLGDTLSKYQYFEKHDRAFLSRLCEGIVERKIQLDYIINQYSSVNTKKMKPVIRNILRMGVYQIYFMDNVPVSAACNEAVKLAQRKGFASLKGFVNGVLRNIARYVGKIEYPNKEQDILTYLSVLYSMPEWIVLKFLDAYGSEKTEEILSAFLEDKKTTICATNKTDRESLKDRLEQQNINVEYGKYSKNALKIDGYNYLSKIKEFKEGLFFVQNESSMCAVEASNIKKDDVVMDICAAPGGKTMYAATLLNGTGSISSRDVSEYKKQLIDDNIRRCGFNNVDTKVFNALELDEEYIEKADVVIADLPCSGLGVIGNKPDIKYKITKDKIDELVKIQRDMLLIASKYVKKGGTLLYSTCTISSSENEENALWFEQISDFKLDAIDNHIFKDLDTASLEKGYIQFLPDKEGFDGFFISKFKKI